jgi:3',5'-cyclic AMP phosphodiesterase CpdA
MIFVTEPKAKDGTWWQASFLYPCRCRAIGTFMEQYEMRVMMKTVARSQRLFVVFSLLLALSSIWGTFGWATESGPLYFVQITDTHWGDKDHIERTRKIVEQINRLPFDVQFVVHTGDITMDRVEDVQTVSEGLRVLKNLKVPVHFVPGNHDILENRLKATRRAYEKAFNSLLYVEEYGGVVFAFVYTEPLARSFSLKGYKPLAQLEKALRRNQGKPVIVFHHTPSVADFYENRMHKGWTDSIRDKWLRLLNSYEVKAVIAGHFHRDEHHWLGAVPLYVCSPVAGYYGRQATFRIYEYQNGRISYRTQYLH